MIGAPPDLLRLGEIAAVSRDPSEVGGKPSKEGLRLHAGQYFGEKALLRQAEVGDWSHSRLAMGAPEDGTHRIPEHLYRN